ncbi:S-layer homology domain-containing protein [Oscillatoria sp. FACHB-1406]|uniref:S-layer homology domain-containing protein n=1 Tax=Oscillatoria sp. FACHB-1406 TaxID=2692846 RepID=UPI001687A138|nr:S-layer homology domain-containing protein [Oscillatoria sp. FACHB-1406]MBD2577166.1 S-layer homology domain-containing protein [Oscillatoria sp. FACHB-1406]
MLYINPTTGNDNAVGSQTAPLKSLTAALKRATPGTTIQLASGTYGNTEVFPLSVPANVTVLGDESTKGKGISIVGSGVYPSATFGGQNVTLLLDSLAQLRGVTVTNPASKGTGIWIESTAPTVANCTLSQCQRDGIFVTGNGKPKIFDCAFVRNAYSGVFFGRNGKGEVRRNRFSQTGYAIVGSDDSAPLLSDNQLLENRIGVMLSRQSKPVLRRNLFSKNADAGLSVQERSRPNLGNSQDPAGNVFEGDRAIDNQTGLAIASVGNQLNPAAVRGNVEFVAAIVPETPSGPTRFADIDRHWAEAFIDSLVQRGLMSGFPDGTFKPEASLTRAEYAAAIAKIFDLPRQLGRTNQFWDVPANFWATAAIQKAADMGFISGFADGSFRAQQNLTRTEALVSIVSGLGLSGGNPDVLLLYRDRAQIPPYATAAIATATQKRLVVNSPDPKQLNPLRDITRAEIAALLYQALVATAVADFLPSPYIVNPDAAVANFTDTPNHWAADFIHRLSSLELISGFSNGSFKPDAPLNRAEYAAFLVRIFNPSPVRPAVQFRDIPPKFWGLNAIQQAYRAGFLSGFPDGTFHPEQTLRRVHLIVSLASGLALPAADESYLNAYEDRASIPAYARSAVAAATKAEIVVLYPKARDLDREVTRAEAAAMMDCALVYRKRVGAIASPYIVRKS